MVPVNSGASHPCLLSLQYVFHRCSHTFSESSRGCCLWGNLCETLTGTGECTLRETSGFAGGTDSLFTGPPEIRFPARSCQICGVKYPPPPPNKINKMNKNKQHIKFASQNSEKFNVHERVCMYVCMHAPRRVRRVCTCTRA